MEPMTVYDVVNPGQARKLVHHHLGNRMMVIAEYSGQEVQEGLGQETCEKAIEEARAHLIGNLYVLVRRLRRFNYQREARKIGGIIDLLIFGDVTSVTVQDAIKAKHAELDPSTAVFSAVVQQLSEQHGH